MRSVDAHDEPDPMATERPDRPRPGRAGRSKITAGVPVAHEARFMELVVELVRLASWAA